MQDKAPFACQRAVIYDFAAQYCGIRDDYSLVLHGAEVSDKQPNHLDVAHLFPDLHAVTYFETTPVSHALAGDNVPMREEEPRENRTSANSDIPLKAPDSDPEICGQATGLPPFTVPVRSLKLACQAFRREPFVLFSGSVLQPGSSVKAARKRATSGANSSSCCRGVVLPGWPRSSCSRSLAGDRFHVRHELRIRSGPFD